MTNSTPLTGTREVYQGIIIRKDRITCVPSGEKRRFDSMVSREPSTEYGPVIGYSWLPNPVSIERAKQICQTM